MEGFSLRACAVVIDAGKVLLQQGDGDDYWALPGGHLQPGEMTQETLARELAEELDGSFHVQELLWVVETWVCWNANHCHQIGFYYRVAAGGLPMQGAFRGREPHLTFRWFALGEIASLDLRPLPVRRALQQPVSGIKHLQWREEASVQAGGAGLKAEPPRA